MRRANVLVTTKKKPMNGNGATPGIWSRRDPVTVLGAWKTAIGPQEIDDLFA
jgi:hypothetical protein